MVYSGTKQTIESESMKTIYKLAILLPLAGLLAAMPLQNGLCECAVEGAVCGDSPTWNPCCEPDKFECVKAEGDDFGTCEAKKDEAKKE